MPVIHVKLRDGQILPVKGEESMVSFLGFGFSLFNGALEILLQVHSFW